MCVASCASTGDSPFEASPAAVLGDEPSSGSGAEQTAGESVPMAVPNCLPGCSRGYSASDRLLGRGLRFFCFAQSASAAGGSTSDLAGALRASANLIELIPRPMGTKLAVEQKVMLHVCRGYLARAAHRQAYILVRNSQVIAMRSTDVSIDQVSTSIEKSKSGDAPNAILGR